MECNLKPFKDETLTQEYREKLKEEAMTYKQRENSAGLLGSSRT